MLRRRFSVEQIIHHLRKADDLLSQGQTVGEVCRRIGVSEQSYYRWRNAIVGLVRQDTMTEHDDVRSWL